MNEVKKTGVSFECTEKQRANYIKAAGGRKLGVWIKDILDAAVKQQVTGGKNKVKPVVMNVTDSIIVDDEDDSDSIGNK
jgi:hypothetical protein